MRRWHRRYDEHGYNGLTDRRHGRVSERQVPLATAEEVLRLYQEKYLEINVRHFPEKLVPEHAIKLSYTSIMIFWGNRAESGAECHKAVTEWSMTLVRLPLNVL